MTPGDPDEDGDDAPARKSCPRCGRPVAERKPTGRPPQFCGDPACWDRAYEKKRYARQVAAAAKAREARKRREEAWRFAETQRLYSAMRQRLTDALGTDTEAPALKVALPRDGALVTVLDAKGRKDLVTRLRGLHRRLGEAAALLEAMGYKDRADGLRVEVVFVDHLIETHFAALPRERTQR